MITKQTIAIIGATGNMGAAIARSLAKGNYRLLLFGKRSSVLNDLEQSILAKYPSADIESADCSYTASWEADIIILAVPYSAEKEIAAKIREVTNQKIVISISNPLNETFDGLVTNPETSAGEELQQLLPHSKVIKAFNTVFAGEINNVENDKQILDVALAGNNKEAVTEIIEMIHSAGMRPVFRGELSASRKLEKMQLDRIISLTKPTFITPSLN